jgi:hypothetical protein
VPVLPVLPVRWFIQAASYLCHPLRLLVLALLMVVLGYYSLPVLPAVSLAKPQ